MSQRIGRIGVSINGSMITWNELRAALGALAEAQDDKHTAQEFFSAMSLIEVIEGEYKDKH